MMKKLILSFIFLSLQTKIICEETSDPAPSIEIPHIAIQEEYEKLSEKHDHFIIKYYSPSCGYCVKLKPEIEKIFTEGVHPIYMVNCADAKTTICSDHKISGYPTVRFVEAERHPDGKVTSSYCDYQGERKAPAITAEFEKFKVKKAEVKAFDTVDEAEVFFEKMKEEKESFIAYSIADDMSEDARSEIDLAIGRALKCRMSETIYQVRIRGTKVSKVLQFNKSQKELYKIDLSKDVAELMENRNDRASTEKVVSQLKKLIELNAFLAPLTKFHPMLIQHYLGYDIPLLLHLLQTNSDFQPVEGTEDKNEDKYLNFKETSEIYKMNREKKAGKPVIAVFMSENDPSDKVYLDVLGLGALQKGVPVIESPDGGKVIALVQNHEARALEKYRLTKIDNGENLKNFLVRLGAGELEQFFKSAEVPDYDLENRQSLYGQLLEVVGLNYERFTKKFEEKDRAAVVLLYVANGLEKNKKIKKAYDIVTELAKCLGEFFMTNKEEKFVRVGAFDIGKNEHSMVTVTGEPKIFLFLAGEEPVEYKEFEGKGIEGLKSLLEEKTGVSLSHVEEETDHEL